MPKIKFKIKKLFKWIIGFLILVLTYSVITIWIEYTNLHTQPTNVSSQAALKNNSGYFNLNEAIKKIPGSAVITKLESNFPENNKSSLVALNLVDITTAITIAIWLIPLFGWLKDAFSIADPVIDMGVIALSWSTYLILKDASSHVAKMLLKAGTGFDSLTATWIAVDLINTLHAINKLRDTVKATNSQFSPPTINQIQQEISQSNK